MYKLTTLIFACILLATGLFAQNIVFEYTSVSTSVGMYKYAIIPTANEELTSVQSCCEPIRPALPLPDDEPPLNLYLREDSQLQTAVNSCCEPIKPFGPNDPPSVAEPLTASTVFCCEPIRPKDTPPVYTTD